MRSTTKNISYRDWKQGRGYIWGKGQPDWLKMRGKISKGILNSYMLPKVPEGLVLPHRQNSAGCKAEHLKCLLIKSFQLHEDNIFHGLSPIYDIFHEVSEQREICLTAILVNISIPKSNNHLSLELRTPPWRTSLCMISVDLPQREQENEGDGHRLACCRNAATLNAS